MYVIIWEYQVKEDCVAEFEKIYGEKGAWAELFKMDSGYLGTELLRGSSHHYLTIDKWNSKKDYESFLSNWKKNMKSWMLNANI